MSPTPSRRVGRDRPSGSRTGSSSTRTACGAWASSLDPLVAYGALPMLLTAGLVMPDGSRLDLVNAHPLPPKISTIAGVPVGLDPEPGTSTCATSGRPPTAPRTRSGSWARRRPQHDPVRARLRASPTASATSRGGRERDRVHVAAGFLERLNAGAPVGHRRRSRRSRLRSRCPGDHCRVTAVVDVPDADSEPARSDPLRVRVDVEARRHAGSRRGSSPGAPPSRSRGPSGRTPRRGWGCRRWRPSGRSRRTRAADEEAIRSWSGRAPASTCEPTSLSSALCRPTSSRSATSSPPA